MLCVCVRMRVKIVVIYSCCCELICRLQEDTHPVLSTYQLSTARTATPIPPGTEREEENFKRHHVEFGRTRVEEYNWNYLDQHICGYSDFEVLGEVRKMEFN